MNIGDTRLATEKQDILTCLRRHSGSGQQQQEVAMRQCRICGEPFDPKKYQVRKGDYECPLCKRRRQNAANAANPLFKEKKRAHNALPHVKAYNANYQSTKIAKTVRAARRKVATEIQAGRLDRGNCEVCGSNRAHAHHKNYERPLDVIWLCRKHHEEIHRVQEK